MNKRTWLHRATSLCALGIALMTSVPVQALDKPDGKVVLTVSGAVSQTNQGKDAAFSMAMLEKLPQRTTKTATPWHEGTVEFTGPLLRDVLKAVGAKGSKLTAVALNDYKTEIPVEDSNKFDVIVATKLNGKSMPVREKGPLFIIYPFSEKPELKAETYYNRSAWQLARLQVQ